MSFVTYIKGILSYVVNGLFLLLGVNILTALCSLLFCHKHNVNGMKLEETVTTITKLQETEVKMLNLLI